MAKNIVVVVVVLIVAIAAVAGMSWYRSITNTPERVVAAFVGDVARADTERTYERFTSSLKKEYTEKEWQEYMRLFDKSSPEPTLVTQEQVKDTFNTYPANNAPQRFVYSFRVQSKEYLATAILYKQGSSWLVDEFQGGYK